MLPVFNEPRLTLIDLREDLICQQHFSPHKYGQESFSKTVFICMTYIVVTAQGLYANPNEREKRCSKINNTLEVHLGFLLRVNRLY